MAMAKGSGFHHKWLPTSTLTHLVVDHLQRNGIVLEVRIGQRIVVLLLVLVGGRHIRHVHLVARLNFMDALLLDDAVVFVVRVAACLDQRLECCVARPLLLRGEHLNVDHFGFDALRRRFAVVVSIAGQSFSQPVSVSKNRQQKLRMNSRATGKKPPKLLLEQNPTTTHTHTFRQLASSKKKSHSL